MRRLTLVAAISLLPTVVAAQDMFNGMQPTYEEPKRSFQVWGGMMIPAFNYSTYVDDIGWNAGAAFIIKPQRYFHVRLEGEYNSIGFQGSIPGSATNYGGGIGGGRSLSNGRGMTTEGYLVAGLYNTDVCVPNLTGSCNTKSELQFGTKIGFNAVVGRGRVRPVFNMYWLYTWGSPYVSFIPITVGLRF